VTDNTPLVTSVIVAYNNEDTVGECVESVLGQDYPKNETIMVYDEGSADGTERKATEVSVKNPESFKVVSIPHTGRSAARNVGWRRGTGEIVFFADADDLYERDYLRKAVEAFSTETIGCVCVTGASLIEGKGIASRMLKIYSLVQQRARTNSRFKPTWAWVYRRKALVETGGFDERLSQAEDKDLFERVKGLGYGVQVVDGIHWFHRRPSSNTAYFKKTFTGGARRVPYLAKRSNYSEFFKSTGIIWLVAGGLVLQLVFPFAFISMLVVLAAALAYRGISTASLIWRDVSDKSELLI
jgi:cellulose synthase/poly-beta-1,6-N-acetylglucosamine synthase-like glycosyltransferase